MNTVKNHTIRFVNDNSDLATLTVTDPTMFDVGRTVLLDGQTLEVTHLAHDLDAGAWVATVQPDTPTPVTTTKKANPSTSRRKPRKATNKATQ